MKTLFLHPEDSPRRGPWTAKKWDCIVDLGKCSASTAADWQRLTGSSVLRLSDFQKNIEDPRSVGQILRRGFGQLRDQLGLDWWELTCLFIHPALETAIAIRRMATEIRLTGELYATRSAWPVRGMAQLLGREIQSFLGDGEGLSEKARRLSSTLRRLSPGQVLEVLWDKYDADYRWRARLVRPRAPCRRPVVLLPSAYTNVSRAAGAFAGLLPEQEFLLVATRKSGLRFDCPPNVATARLEEYAGPNDGGREFAELDENWSRLQSHLTDVPEMAMLASAGNLGPIQGLVRTGLAVRNAWAQVFEREPVTAVLCGDDSNWFTRIPVLLAAKRNLPTVDFHHGAFDGRFLLKDLSSNAYVAKNAMERDYLLRVCGLPAERVVVSGLSPASGAGRQPALRAGNIVFFSEPYESAGSRPEEIYRELLPPLCRVAVERGCRLLVKLHPFENASERARLIETALGPGWRERVDVVSGPTTPGLLESAWFGIAVESTTLVDCARNHVPCFHCAWLVSNLFGYSEQYARFGVGRLLRSGGELAAIPDMLAEGTQAGVAAGLESPPSPELLRKLLAGGEPAVIGELHGRMQGRER
jgi:hypothetical protein